MSVICQAEVAERHSEIPGVTDARQVYIRPSDRFHTEIGQLME